MNEYSHNCSTCVYYAGYDKAVCPENLCRVSYDENVRAMIENYNKLEDRATLDATKLICPLYKCKYWMRATAD